MSKVERRAMFKAILATVATIAIFVAPALAAVWQGEEELYLTWWTVAMIVYGSVVMTVITTHELFTALLRFFSPHDCESGERASAQQPLYSVERWPYT